MIEKKAKQFLYKFFQKNSPLFSDENDYLNNFVLNNSILNKKEGIKIFGKRIKNAYIKYINDEFTETLFEQCLQIIITENLTLSYKVLERTKTAIVSGIYDEELNIINDKIEFETLDWGVENWKI